MTDGPLTVGELDSDILAGIVGARSGSLHFPAYFSGLSFDAVGDGACTVSLPARPQVLDRNADFAAMAICLTCDIGMGAAVRAKVGRRCALPTVSLNLDFTLDPIRTDRLVCDAVFVERVGDLAVARCQLTTSDATPVGRACGRFLVQPRDSGEFNRYPWQREAIHPVQPSELTDRERQIRSYLLDGLAVRPEHGGLYESLYRVTASPASPAGSSCLVLPIGPHLANRTGNVQGGVLAGLLSDACRAAADTDAKPHSRLVSLSCTFLRPGRLDRKTVTAKATTVFSGRRLACVSAEASHDIGTPLARAEGLLTPGAH